MRRRAVWACGAACLALAAVLLAYVPAGAQTPVIVRIDLEDIVHPISSTYLREGLNHAADVGAAAVVVRLNTPGGLVDSMKEMVEAILTSPVPVIVWVGPDGARASSAGFFLLLAGDLALMAPGTNTGAAHPVSIMGGEIDETMETKIVSDTAAYIRSYVAHRGRNADAAEQGVVESRSFTADEALRENLIDGVVHDVNAIVSTYGDQEIVRFDGTPTRLDLAGASVEPYEMTLRQRLLSRVMNPNVALVLALVGLLGLYFELTNPGLIVPGVIGAIALILALFAFNLLPVNWAGAGLILLAIILFVLEATTASSGILAIGGIVAMIAGGLMLVEGPIPQLRIQLSTVLAVTFPVAVITVFLVRLVFLSHRQKSVVGGEGMIGKQGVAISDIHQDGRAMVHGEYWNAFSASPIPAGAKVRVKDLHGLRIEVETDPDPDR